MRCTAHRVLYAILSWTTASNKHAAHQPANMVGADTDSVSELERIASMSSRADTHI